MVPHESHVNAMLSRSGERSQRPLGSALVSAALYKTAMTVENETNVATRPHRWNEPHPQTGVVMSESTRDQDRTRIEVRIESAMAPTLEVGTEWKVVASSPASLFEGHYTVTLEKIQTDS
jgi:hypothetical protein